MNNAENREVIQIPLDDIIPNRFQPRLTFDIDALNELARSIKEHGIIQPLVVRAVQNKYEIIAGERRYKAASIAGLEKVPCIVMDLNDSESAEVAIIENIQRKEMTPLEEAKSFKKLLDKGYLTQEDLGKRMGKSQSSIANKLRLLNLDDSVQDAILNNKISERHARSLLRLENKSDQRKALSEIISRRLTVKQTDDLIKEEFGGKSNMNDFNQVSSSNNNKFISSSEDISVPKVNIPDYGNSGNSNPQLNLLNSLGNPKVEDQNYSDYKKEPDDNFPDEATNPALDIFRDNSSISIPKPNIPTVESKIEIPVENDNKAENLIDPSKLDSLVDNYNKEKEPEIKESSININLDEIKEEAKNIKPEEAKPADLESLLHTDNIQHENKFIKPEISTKDSINSIESSKNDIEFLEVNEKQPDYMLVKEKITEDIKLLKEKGIKLYKEEADFGNTYQIIIRIDK